MTMAQTEAVADVVLWRCPTCGKVETNTSQRKRYCGVCTRQRKDRTLDLKEMDRWEYGPLRRVR
jgi:hypothetical protein